MLSWRCLAKALRLFILALLCHGLSCCGCLLEGKIGDVPCSAEEACAFNNLKIYPRLASLLEKQYFKFYRINLHKPCPFWSNDTGCSLEECEVTKCTDNDLPKSLKAQVNGNGKPPNGNGSGERCDPAEKSKIESLSRVDPTVSEENLEQFQSWHEHDDAYDFCDLDGDANGAEDGEFVDLILNPERYTGYKGRSPHRVWRAIYAENCFSSEREFKYGRSNMNGLCVEQRVFYRLISGLHSSISVHLSAMYYNKKRAVNGLPEWGPNVDEFLRRFGPTETSNQGLGRLRNLYFIYLVELKALVKAAPLLHDADFYTGEPLEDTEVSAAVTNFLDVVRSFPHHFDEHQLFNGDMARFRLRDELRAKFRNISRIMDCVGCDKCRLWGKLQTFGLGTALKIIFWPDTEPGPRLERQEIVALFNAFGRLSHSLYEVEEFAEILKAQKRGSAFFTKAADEL